MILNTINEIFDFTDDNSIKLVDQLQECGQKYLFRLPKTTLKNFSDQLEIGEDKVFNLTFDRAIKNRYCEDSKFRTKFMNTTYPIRLPSVLSVQIPMERLLKRFSLQTFHQKNLISKV